ncbi:hypothetical protein HII31_11648 [Pseudocercospora fuligena]|uniref:Uncharacterized protein n=1 Tax=Pseudocercospora fuligena TaxID=685502 RepID=A0A8H6R9T9_9PEZI|nr:hypothetical protein HII31_11648 [Pseudocercospora fuligena]
MSDDGMDADDGQQEPLFGPIYEHSPDWDNDYIMPKTYEKVLFYAIDYDRNALVPENAAQQLKQHRYRCRIMTQFFDECTVAETFDLYFPPGCTMQDWTEFWDGEKLRFNSRTLVYIYFNGKSHGLNQGYSWIIPGINEHVNAYKFIEDLDTTDADFTYLLDCWCQTRWNPKFSRRDNPNGMTEFILAGMPVPNRNGNIGVYHTGDFAPSFVRILTNWLRHPPTTEKEWARARKYMQSTPKLMIFDKTLYNNCTRVWVNKPQKDDHTEIWRITIDPVLAWKRGVIHFFGKYIQPKPEAETYWEPEDLGLMEDEGVVADQYTGDTNDGPDGSGDDDEDDEDDEDGNDEVLDEAREEDITTSGPTADGENNDDDAMSVDSDTLFVSQNSGQFDFDASEVDHDITIDELEVDTAMGFPEDGILTPPED